MEECFTALANGIVIQAARDYRKALRILRRYPNHEPAKEVKAEVEDFFRSDWYKTLTNVDGELLIKKLQEA